VRSWVAIAVVLSLVACGVKAPPRPPTRPGADVPEAPAAPAAR